MLQQIFPTTSTENLQDGNKFYYHLAEGHLKNFGWFWSHFQKRKHYMVGRSFKHISGKLRKAVTRVEKKIEIECNSRI